MNKVLVIVLVLLAMVVVPINAAELHMNAVVSKIDGGHVEFTDKSGNFFFFTDVVEKLNIGDKAELVVDAIFDGENFKVRDMEIEHIQNISVKFPETDEELVAMYAGIVAIGLAMFFGGFIAGHLHSKPKKNRRIYHGNS